MGKYPHIPPNHCSSDIHLLTTGVSGDDDYFSSDLADAQVAQFWGRFQQPILILMSGADKYVPKTVNQAELIKKWIGFCAPGIAHEKSGLVHKASHEVLKKEAQIDMAERVVKFLKDLGM